ncbi:MAG: hypothetical protein ACFHWZ_15250 [Phycisphaerales bacterium]
MPRITAPPVCGDEDARSVAASITPSRRKGDGAPDISNAAQTHFDAVHAGSRQQVLGHRASCSHEAERLAAEAEALSEDMALDPQFVRKRHAVKGLLSVPVLDGVGELGCLALGAAFSVSLYLATASLLVSEDVISSATAAWSICLPLAAGGMIAKLLLTEMYSGSLRSQAAKRLRVVLFSFGCLAFAYWAYQFSGALGETIFESLSGADASVPDLTLLQPETQSRQVDGRTVFGAALIAEVTIAAAFFMKAAALREVRTKYDVVEPQVRGVLRAKLEGLRESARHHQDCALDCEAWLAEYDANSSDFARRVSDAFKNNSQSQTNSQ